MIIPLRAPGDATGKARLQRGRPRRVVAAKRERHDADPLWIEFTARGQIFVSRRCVILGLGNQRQIAKAHALAVSRSIDDQATNAAGGEVGNAIAVLQLLCNIEAVEKYYR